MNRLLTAFYSLTLDDQDLEYFKFRAIEREALEDYKLWAEDLLEEIHHCWANGVDPSAQLDTLQALSSQTGLSFDHRLGLA